MVRNWLVPKLFGWIDSLTVIVDICITTPWKGLEKVCMIAELLDRCKILLPLPLPALET